MMNARQVQRNKQSFFVLPSETYRRFWDEFSNATWEPETFLTFDHYIDESTVFVDVGAWIGPTALYAAGIASECLAFEPDPVAYAELEANLALNSDRGRMSANRVAIASKSGVLRMGSQHGAGDSMSSALFSEGKETWEVRAETLAFVESLLPRDAPVFLKIDIEGGEYSLLPALGDFIRRRRPVMLLSLHPAFFLNLPNAPSILMRLRRELCLFSQWARAIPILRQFSNIHTADGGPSMTLGDCLKRGTWRYTHCLLLANRPPPWALADG